MLGLFNTVTGQVTAKEKDKTITLYGLNGYSLTKEIEDIWNTTRITKHVFTDIGRLSVSFHKFFLIDILYTLEVIKEESKISLSRRSLLKAIDELKNLTDLRTVFDDYSPKVLYDKSKLSKIKISPLPWQEEYLDIYSDRLQRYNLKGHLLDAAPGTGKTLGSLFLMESLDTDTIIVLTPKPAITKPWVQTFENDYRQSQKVWHSLLGYPPSLGYQKYLLHYEYLPKFMQWLKTINPRSLGNIGIIVDENHLLNEETSERSKLTVSLCQNYAKYSLWMSGTPLKAMGKEVIPLFSAIDPLFDKDARHRFVNVFGKASDRALDILRNRMGKVSHQVRKEEAVSDIPLYRYQANITLPNGKEYTLSSIREKMKKYIEERSLYYKDHEEDYKQDYFEAISYYKDVIKGKHPESSLLSEYLSKVEMIKKGYDPIKHKEDALYCNNFEKKYIIPTLPSEMKASFRKAKSVYKYVNLTIMGECLGSVLGKARSDCNKDIALNLGNMRLIPQDNSPPLGTMSLDEIINNAKKKTLIFSSFVDVVTSISDKLSSQGYKPLVVYGETNVHLPRIIKEFETLDIANPLIATFQSLSTAVPITSANTTINLNIPFREYQYKQAIARTWRKGQDTECIVIDCLLDTGNEPNISTRSNDIANEAAAIVARIMGYNTTIIDQIASESHSKTRSLSTEGCTSCQTNKSLTEPSRGILKDNTHSFTENEIKSPYYQTDIGPSIDEIVQLTDDDPIWESDHAKLLLKDIPNTAISKESINKPKYHDW